MVYLLIAIIVALLVGGLARMRSKSGYLVTIVLATLGAWLFVSFLQVQVTGDKTMNGISLFGDLNVAGVPLVGAIIGALLFALLGVVIYRRRETKVIVT
ncbi:MAG: hypothetical protein WCS37_14230 [Chloroflexota bacterium]